MKKLFACLLTMLFICSLVGCGRSDGSSKDSQTTKIDPLAGHNLSNTAKVAYKESFNSYFSAEEYIDLIKRLKNVLNDESVEPIFAVNENYLFVIHTIDRYDLYEESMAVVDVNGNLKTQWNTKWKPTDVRKFAKCGDYFFVVTEEDAFHDLTCEVINQQGEILSTIVCPKYRYDLGDGYVYFSRNNIGYIMNPDGEVIQLEYGSVRLFCGSLPYGELTKDQSIGTISEGLFYCVSNGNDHTAACYYNTNGEVVIDLSTRAVNFKVTQLYNFKDGKARVKFTGANGKKYEAYIDHAGNFIGEPVEK